MKYKTVKKSVPWCDACNQEITGNGSINTPYECGCGEWKWEWDGQYQNSGAYVLQKK